MERTGGTHATQGFLTFVAAATMVAACGGQTGIPDDGSLVDRPIDSPLDPPIDAPAIDAPSPIDATVDAAGCGQAVLLNGYYLDWDSTLNNPIGLGGSRWSLGATQTEAAPSGLVSMCIPAGAPSVITVTGPGVPPNDYIGARFVADPAVFSVPNTRFLVRGVQKSGPTGIAAQYNEFGATYNSAFAQVLVYNVGTPIPLALSPTLTPPQTSYVNGGNFNDVTWSAGDTGKLTLFPNRPVTPNMATLTSTGHTFIGPTEIPLVSGAFTIVVIRTQN